MSIAQCFIVACLNTSFIQFFFLRRVCSNTKCFAKWTIYFSTTSKKGGRIRGARHFNARVGIMKVFKCIFFLGLEADISRSNGLAESDGEWSIKRYLTNNRGCLSISIAIALLFLLFRFSSLSRLLREKHFPAPNFYLEFLMAHFVFPSTVKYSHHGQKNALPRINSQFNDCKMFNWNARKKTICKMWKKLLIIYQSLLSYWVASAMWFLVL